jgi:hypothetical protein
MGCCGNKAGCKKTAEPENFTAPPAELWVGGLHTLNVFVNELQELVSAGINAGKIFRGLDLQNEALTQLAKRVADLAIENAYFKSVLNLFTPADLRVQHSTLEINFGPQHQYQLTLPVTCHNSRREIIRQLRDAADKLEAEMDRQKQTANTAQQTFSFVSTK